MISVSTLMKVGSASLGKKVETDVLSVSVDIV
jgi:hypothetical protein